MSILSVLHKPTFASLTWLFLGVIFLGMATAGQFGTPKGEEGTRIFKATEHPTYSGQFRLTGRDGMLVGSMGDKAPWDHMDYAGKHLVAIEGTIEIEVDEAANSGLVEAKFVEGNDQYRMVFARFAGVAPNQDGGLAKRAYEHQFPVRRVKTRTHSPNLNLRCVIPNLLCDCFKTWVYVSKCVVCRGGQDTVP